MFSPYQMFLAVLMVITGSINTITTKWADELEAAGRDGHKRPFNHPFLQACCMFVGESLCLFTFWLLYAIYKRRGDGSEDTKLLTKGNRHFNRFLLMAPAMLDMTATSAMYIGLNMTYASSFQMLRGSVIIFTGIMSVLFLGKKLHITEWIGMLLVILGLALVGTADFISAPSGSSKSTTQIIIGDVIIIVAQIVVASQMVIEEKFVSGKDLPPLQAVGLEGIFGFSVLALLCIPFYYIYVGPDFSDNTYHVLEDAIEGFIQMGNNPLIIVGLLGTVFSIAFFNFAGISVTKEMSSTTRMVLDSVRTLIVYVFSLALFGQTFHWLQILGFFFLILGMCIYNNLMPKRFQRRYSNLEDDTVVNTPANA